MAGNQTFTLVKLSPILASPSQIYFILCAIGDSNSRHEFNISKMEILLIKNSKALFKIVVKFLHVSGLAMSTCN